MAEGTSHKKNITNIELSIMTKITVRSFVNIKIRSNNKYIITIKSFNT
jgi:hypothetical protein